MSVNPRTRTAFTAAFIALLALPRIARLVYPQIWIEDESYLNGAFMLARGWMPYRDFPLPHLPALELMMAAVFKVAPISIRTAEVVSAAAAFAGSVLVFAIGVELTGARAGRSRHRTGDRSGRSKDLHYEYGTGVWAAIIFATSALLFRYHIFEREVFDVVPVLVAVWMVERDQVRLKADDVRLKPDTTYIVAGALVALAMAIKLTAVAALVALALQLLVTGRRRQAIVMTATAVGLVGLLSLVLAAVFGQDFIVQVVVFRLVHATFPSLATKIDEMRMTLDVSLAAGAAGIVWLVWTGRARRWAGPLLQLASGFVFLVLLNPTYWAHTGIELLPWLALAGGALVAAIPARRTPAIVCAAAAIGLLVYVAPIRNLNWEAGDGSTYGFGYRDRHDIARAADYVRAHSADDALVATPPIIALAANRREVVPYGEVAGEIDEITALVRRDGYLAALRSDQLRERGFWDSVRASQERMEPALDAALDAHRIAVVIDDSSDDLFPIAMVSFPQEQLERAGLSARVGVAALRGVDSAVVAGGSPCAPASPAYI